MSSDESMKNRSEQSDEAKFRTLVESIEKWEEFANVAMHSLTEPLRGLMIDPERLAKDYGGALDERANDWINRTISAANRMKHRMEGLRQYVYHVMMRGQDLVTVDSAQIVTRVCTIRQVDLEACHAEVVVGRLPVLIGNPGQFMLLFEKLIDNAIRYRQPDRRLRVEIDAVREHDSWHFRVSDNGIGIEEELIKTVLFRGEIHRLFQEGKGYGLFICEKIVAQRGGRMWGVSKVGEGSSFFLSWPVS